MRFWLTTVVLLILATQIFQALKVFFVPLPIYILAGAFLAIASNYDKGIIPKFKIDSQDSGQTDQSLKG